MSDNLGSAFNPKKSAIFNLSSESSVKKSWTGKKKTCWQCQKDKSTVGGHIKAAANFFKFVCKDCCDANAKKKQDET